MNVTGVEDHEDERFAAETALRNLSGLMTSTLIVAPGDSIDVDLESGFLRGHGCQIVDGKLLATVSGVVERVNKLVTVRRLKSRYVAETGDVVVGRVTSIGGKRWNVEINSRSEAGLMLSAVNLPGGVQRRRTNVDELNMRAMFAEGDLISCEVQQVTADGTVSLHARSLKYGKLEGGMLVQVPSQLIKRQKHHFQHLESLGVDVIFGCNGFIWVGCHVEPPADPTNPQKMEVDEKPQSVGTVELEVRGNICRVANAMKTLGKLFLPIHAHSVLKVFELSVSLGMAAKDMLGNAFQTKVLEMEVDRRKGE